MRYVRSPLPTMRSFRLIISFERLRAIEATSYRTCFDAANYRMVNHITNNIY